MKFEINDNPSRDRYEAIVTETETETAPGGTVAGFIEYSVQDGRVVLPHTEVDPAFEGQGIGSALVRAALDDVRRQGRNAVPVCPFVRSWLDRHPDYADLVRPT
jgi:predicted GNAT family acetyltransferase